MSSTDAELHTLTGAYSLHALPESERTVFERHMAACEPCEQEVREFTATAERLGLASAVTPPPGMRQRVLREITTVRQDPPRTSGRSGGEGASGGSSGSWRSGWRMRRLPRLVLAASLAAAAALGGVGGVAVWQYQAAEDARQRAERAETRAETLARVLAAPDAKVATGQLVEGATGTVVVSRDEDRAVFFASGLAEAPKGRVYQLWFSDSGTMRPAGLLDGSARGETVLMKGPVGDASAMGITVEPAGGSKQPTSAPLALLKLPGAGGGGSHGQA